MYKYSYLHSEMDTGGWKTELKYLGIDWNVNFGQGSPNVFF